MQNGLYNIAKRQDVGGQREPCLKQTETCSVNYHAMHVKKRKLSKVGTEWWKAKEEERVEN